MLQKFSVILAPLILLLLTACFPLAGTLEVGVETPTASAGTPEFVVTPEPTPAALTGTVSGRVCYPSEFIPAMTAYFQQTSDGSLTEITIAENQATYTAELAPGTYRAFAWVEETQLGGAFTAYVACGYAETCTDHALLSFEVQAGQETTHVDICDWPFPAEQLPLPIPPTSGNPTLAGMIYNTSEGTLFRLDANGSARSLSSALGMVISPDQTYGLYPQNGDLFVTHLTTGEQINLTNTPDIIEILYQWPLQDTIFFTALPAGDGGGPGATGGLYRIRPDGTGYTVIDAETNAGNFAISPDGRFAAYGSGLNAFLYDLELNQRGVFDPTTFGLSSPNGLYVSSPSWAPNGQKIAWITQGDFNGQGAFAVVVFDLNTHTYEIIHPYQIIGMDGFLPPARFSPDGNWVAFQAFEEDFTRNGVWVASVGDPNQSIETFLGVQSSSPFWSPDGQWVAFHQYVEAEQAQRVFLFNPGSNSIFMVPELPLNANVIDW